METSEIIKYLEYQFENARALLFTGAGFTLGAKDIDGRLLPSGRTMSKELWDMCFPGDTYDESSSLQDLYDHALRTKRSELKTYMINRLTLNSQAIPEYYKRWYTVPWRRIYTLNVDNMENAVAIKYDFSRQHVSFSATTGNVDEMIFQPYPMSLYTIHINGCIDDVPDDVTFSRKQYGERLGHADPWYSHMVNDLATLPIIFVGTQLEEPSLWQYIIERKKKSNRPRELRPRSFLVTPKLDKPRQSLLTELNVVWIAMTAEEFSNEILEPLTPSIQKGIDFVFTQKNPSGTGTQSIPDVSSLASLCPQQKKSLFLLGKEPSWDDIRSGRAIERAIDTDLIEFVKENLKNAEKKPVLLLTGTAGSGKTTSLMRLALEMSNSGVSVGWLDDEIDLGPRQIVTGLSNPDAPEMLFIDCADRYGTSLCALLNDIVVSHAFPLIVLSMRGTKVDKFLNPLRLSSDVEIAEKSMPRLTNSDINSLLDGLQRDGLLGVLRGLSRSEQFNNFKEHANRQLLVALYQATSGKSFEEKVGNEYQELEGIAKELYGTISVASSLGYQLDRDGLLIAVESSNQAMNEIESLKKRGLIIEGNLRGAYRARHRMVADVLSDYLATEGHALRYIESLAWMGATRVSRNGTRNSKEWRFVKRIINHDYLIRMSDAEQARGIYCTLQDILDWDYQYWLQRGSLELQEESLDLAENYLNQARAYAEDDYLVQTAWAHLLFKKALNNPGIPESSEYVEEAVSILRDRIRNSGYADVYPIHILGSQSLSWLRRKALPRREKQRWLEMICSYVEEACKHHCRNDNLSQLRVDLEREKVGFAVLDLNSSIKKNE